ncbi:MAG: hypothetical protein LBJ36_03640 [Synergistaceae bacterium]|nr:hypothetical protein [Synergistaceae bacterium]
MSLTELALKNLKPKEKRYLVRDDQGLYIEVNSPANPIKVVPAVPTPVRELRPDPDQTVVLVEVFMPPFRERMNNKAVTKTVTVPRWLEMEAKTANLNYSKILQEGIMERLGIFREIDHRPGKKKQKITL